MKKSFVATIIILLILIHYANFKLYVDKKIICATIISLVVIVTILLSPLNFKIKIIMIVFILIIYRKNYILISGIVTIFYKYKYTLPVSTREDNSVIQKDVLNLYKSIFNFKHNFHILKDESTPKIFLCNYIMDRCENPASVVIPHLISYMMTDILSEKMRINTVLKYVITRKASGNDFENMIKMVNYYINIKKISVLAYITERSNVRNSIGRVRTGMFTIAKTLNVPIINVAIDQIETGEFMNIVHQNFEIRIGKTRHVKDISRSVKKSQDFFRKCLSDFKRNKFIF